MPGDRFQLLHLQIFSGISGSGMFPATCSKSSLLNPPLIMSGSVYYGHLNVRSKLCSRPCRLLFCNQGERTVQKKFCGKRSGGRSRVRRFEERHEDEERNLELTLIILVIQVGHKDSSNTDTQCHAKAILSLPCREPEASLSCEDKPFHTVVHTYLSREKFCGSCYSKRDSDW